jgi:hypothetical protein
MAQNILLTCVVALGGAVRFLLGVLGPSLRRFAFRQGAAPYAAAAYMRVKVRLGSCQTSRANPVSAPILRPRSQADKPPGEGEVIHLIRQNTGKLPKDYRHAIDLLADLPHTRSIKGSLNCRTGEEIS